MSTRFKVWIDSPDDSGSGNVMSQDDFNNDSQRSAGYIAGVPVPSKKMNTILREISLITTALMDQFCPNSTVSLTSTLANVKTAIGAGIASKASVTDLSSTVSSLSTTVSNITGSSGPIAAVDTRVDNIVGGTTKVGAASTADVATNVGDITNDDTGANATIAFSIGSGTNKKSFRKTITVSVPGTAEYAVVVTDSIRIGTNDVPIDSIFNVDGSAKNAVSADTAASAAYATSAGTASNATNANYATSAGTANSATSAESAYSCTEATVAEQATTTDFTHSSWTTKDIGLFDTLVKGATYEVQVNESNSYPNVWYPYPLITIPSGNTGGVHAICWMSSSGYTEFTYDNALGSGGVVNTSTYPNSSKWRYRRIR